LEALLEYPNTNAHIVQFYDDDRALARNVGKYIAEGLSQGCPSVVIATDAHRALFCEELRLLGADVSQAVYERRLVFLDAQHTLNRFMVDGLPEWDRFRRSITSAVEALGRHDHASIRAYGEMVGLLWVSGEYSAAIRLEEFWNRILSELGADLYCSYPIDLFSTDFQSSAVHAILCDHTHLVPWEDDRNITSALRLAIGEVIGSPRLADTYDRMNATSRKGWGEVPEAERMVLWLRENLPDSTGEILRRTRMILGKDEWTALSGLPLS
jgi:hypothetical protein